MQRSSLTEIRSWRGWHRHASALQACISFTSINSWQIFRHWCTFLGYLPFSTNCCLINSLWAHEQLHQLKTSVHHQWKLFREKQSAVHWLTFTVSLIVTASGHSDRSAEWKPLSSCCPADLPKLPFVEPNHLLGPGLSYGLQEFVCALSSKPLCHYINGVHYRLFGWDLWAEDQMPPTADSLLLYCKKATFQTSIHCFSFKHWIHAQPLTEHEWEVFNQQLKNI